MGAPNYIQLDEQNPHHSVELFKIATQMKEAGLSDHFISSAIRCALVFEGVADLVQIWSQENDLVERNEIIADIQEMVDACAQPAKEEHSRIKINDLESVAKDIRQFKDSLLEIVIQKGGLNSLAKKTGIPQPSLSRFFNSNAMPRRATLLKIGRALDLSTIDLESKWAR